MLVDAFTPAYQGTITVSVTASNTTTALPAGGDWLELQNSSASVIVFVELGNAQVTAAVASGYPLLPGAAKIIKRHKIGDQTASAVGNPDQYIAAIGSAAGPTNFYVTAGTGT